MADKVGEIFVALGLKNQQFKQGWKESQKLVEKSSKNMISTATRLSIGLTAPLTLIGKASFNEFRKFDKAMTQSTAIMRDMTVEIKKSMEEQAHALSFEGVKSASELAESYMFMASAGLDANEALANQPTILKFATAGMLGLDNSVKLLINSQNALGLRTGDTIEDMKQMARVGDALVLANQLAASSTEGYANALTNKAAAALKVANKELEEGVAVLTAFAKAGIHGARAGTFLDIALRELRIKATENEEAFGKMNVKVFDGNGEMRNMADIIENLENRFGGLSTKQKTLGLLQLGFNRRSAFAIQTLIGHSKAIRDNEAALRSAGGTMDKVSNEILKGFDAQVTKLGHKFNFLKAEIGSEFVPAIEGMNEAMKHAIVLWKTLDDETKTLIVQLGAAAAAIGPILGLFGAMKLMIPFLGKGLALLALLAGKLILVGGTITAIVASFDFLANTDLGTKMKIVALEIIGAWDQLNISIGFWAQEILQKFDVLWETVKFAAIDAAMATKETFKSMFEGLVDEASRAWQNLKSLVGKDNPFEQSQVARENVAFARQRVEEAGLGADTAGSRTLDESLFMLKAQGLSDKQIGDAIGRIRDLHVALQEQQDAHDSVMKEKGKRQDAFKSMLENQTDLRAQKAASLKKSELEITRLIHQQAIQLNKESDVDFVQHVQNRVRQFTKGFLKMKETNEKEYDEMTKKSNEHMDGINKKWKDTTKEIGEATEIMTKEMEEYWKNMESGFTGAWENMFTKMMEGTATLQDAFQALGMEILKVVAQQSLIKPLSSAFGGGTAGAAAGIFGSIAGMFGGVGGGIAGGGGDIPTTGLSPTPLGPGFANGGAFGAGHVLNTPTPFRMANGGVGIAGEAGPEAALPLKRLSNGKLGVQTDDAGTGRSVTQIFNITTQDADSFKRSQRQISKRMRNV